MAGRPPGPQIWRPCSFPVRHEPRRALSLLSSASLGPRLGPAARRASRLAQQPARLAPAPESTLPSSMASLLLDLTRAALPHVPLNKGVLQANTDTFLDALPLMTMLPCLSVSGAAPVEATAAGRPHPALHKLQPPQQQASRAAASFTACGLHKLQLPPQPASQPAASPCTPATSRAPPPASAPAALRLADAPAVLEAEAVRRLHALPHRIHPSPHIPLAAHAPGGAAKGGRGASQRGAWGQPRVVGRQAHVAGMRSALLLSPASRCACLCSRLTLRAPAPPRLVPPSPRRRRASPTRISWACPAPRGAAWTS